MGDIGKILMLTVILAIVLIAGIAGIGAWEHFTDPRIQANRDFELTLREQSQARLQPTIDRAKEISIWIGLAFLAGMAEVLWRFLDSRVQRVYPVGSLYPAREIKPSLFQRGVAFFFRQPMPETYWLPAPNEPRAQLGNATLRGLQPGARLTSAAVRGLLTAGEVVPVDEPQDGPRYLTVEDVTTVNLRTDPHLFIVGASGAGKSNATYAMAKALERVGAEFVICERWRRTWYTQAHATVTDTISQAIDAVYLEYIRRQQLMDQHDVQHIADLQVGPGPLVLLIEEFADFWDKFRKYEKARVEEVKSEVNELAREGRKTGITLFLVSQSPVSDVIDGEVRKNMNVLLFRSEFTVDRTWGVPKWADLPTLPVGTAYSVRHGGLVEFPLTTRPTLHGSEIYLEPVGTLQRYTRQMLAEDSELTLPEDIEEGAFGSNPDGSGVTPGVIDGSTGVIDDAASVTGEAGSVIDSVITPQSHSKEPQTASLATLALELLPITLDDNAQLDQRQMDLIWRAFTESLDMSTGRPVYSMRATHRALWPDIEPGGGKSKLIKRAVLTEAQKRNIGVRVVQGLGVTLAGRNGRAVKINGGSRGYSSRS